MKLAEALAERAAAQRRIESLRSRVVGSARYQEGEPPSEDAAALLVEAAATVDEFESLVRRINRTNSGTVIEGGTTLTDALARRDAQRLRHAVLTSAADAAAGSREHGYVRQLRSELRMISALPVAQLREQADVVAREIRELDARIQRANWEADLAE